MFGGVALRLAAVLVATVFIASAAWAFDAASLREIPRFDVIDLATGRFHFIGVADDEHRVAQLEAIGQFDPQVQTLVWLSVFDQGLSLPVDQPTLFMGTDRFLPEMTRALREAGSGDADFLRQAELFADAVPRAVPSMPGNDTGSLHFVTITPGVGFGPKAEIEQRILAYVDRSPKVAEWLDGKHAAFGGEERVSALLTMISRLPEFYSSKEYDTWPAPYRTLVLVQLFEGELVNGGVEQFFANSSGNQAEATLEALRTIGLLDQASVVERGIALFPAPYPRDRKTRLPLLTGPLDRDLDALTTDAMRTPALPVMAAFAEREGLLPR